MLLSGEAVMMVKWGKNQPRQLHVDLPISMYLIGFFRIKLSQALIYISN